MAIVKGTNAGFVGASPSGDPSGDANFTADDKINGMKDATGAANIVTEIGWWCNTATEAANYEVGIYAHNSGGNKPGALLFSSTVQAKGTTAGWKKATGLSFSLSVSTTYWICIQLDNTATTTSGDWSVVGGERYSNATGHSSLPNPWDAGSSEIGDRLLAVYALVEESSPGVNDNMGIIGEEVF